MKSLVLRLKCLRHKNNYTKMPLKKVRNFCPDQYLSFGYPMPHRDDTRDEHQQLVRRVLQFIRQRFIRQHSERQLTLPDLAEIACQTPYHFERIFKEQTGLTVMKHVRHVKLVQSALELRLTNRKIIDIALEAGYSNHESYSRAFRKHFDQSPSHYRREYTARSLWRLKTARQNKGTAMEQVTIGLVKIPVSDFGKATHYYREIVGLEEEFAVEAYGWAQYKTGNVPLCLYVTGQGGGDGIPGSEVGFHLVVDNAEAFYQQIQSRGGQFASEIVKSDDGGRFFVLRDPDGNTFKVMQRTA